MWITAKTLCFVYLCLELNCGKVYNVKAIFCCKMHHCHSSLSRTSFAARNITVKVLYFRCVTVTTLFCVVCLCQDSVLRQGLSLSRLCFTARFVTVTTLFHGKMCYCHNFVIWQGVSMSRLCFEARFVNVTTLFCGKVCHCHDSLWQGVSLSRPCFVARFVTVMTLFCGKVCPCQDPVFRQDESLFKALGMHWLNDLWKL